MDATIIIDTMQDPHDYIAIQVPGVDWSRESCAYIETAAEHVRSELLRLGYGNVALPNRGEAGDTLVLAGW